MPTKFVERAAERAGVSIETAEQRWSEAKKAIKKGKRRGHWYWGKVVNTFKKMMGLSESITLKEWMLFEGEQLFANWPEVIQLFGPYVAVRTAEEDGFVMYQVEVLLGDSTGVQLSASKLPSGGASYTVGLDNDFAQGLGINVKGSDAGDVKTFRHWAVDALQSSAERLGLSESMVIEAGDTPVKQILADWPTEFYVKDGFIVTLDEHKRGKSVYHITKLMEDTPIAKFYAFRRKVGDMEHWWQLVDARSNQTIKVESKPRPIFKDLETLQGWLEFHLRSLAEECETPQSAT